MARCRRFLPAPITGLEPRCVPSGIVAQVAPHVVPKVLHLSGTFTTTTKHGVDTANAVSRLSGTNAVNGLGTVSFADSLQENAVYPFFRSRTQGRLTITDPSRPGSALMLKLDGPYGNLDPDLGKSQEIDLTFQVASATGKFLPYANGHGTAHFVLTTTKVLKSLPLTTQDLGTVKLTLRMS
jgi:hypothetical protein